MQVTAPIGVFDSGVGGLTVVKALLDQLPGESIVYYGDTAHVPYGNKTEQQLMGYAHNIISFLLENEAKAIVVACNTSSSVTLPQLRNLYSIPLLGVLKAAVRSACRMSVTQKIGVMATQATVNAGAYTRDIHQLNPQCEVYEIACPRLVPLVEAGRLSGNETEEAVAEYLGPLLEQKIDTLILGCTHYPFLEPVIRKFAGRDLHIVDPSADTVEDLRTILSLRGLLSNNVHPLREFYVSGNDESFYNVGRLLIGNVIGKVKKLQLD